MSREDSNFVPFLLNFFRVQGILYTKIGIDELDEIWSTQFTHLVNYLNDIDKQTNKLNEIMKM